MRTGYAFVASTMPLYWLSKNLNNNNIQEIVVASEELYETYKILISNHKNLKLSVVPKKQVFKIIFILFKVAQCRFSKKRIFFFHECCWIYLDLIIKLFRPQGCFLPQASMDSFELVEQKKFNLFSLIGFLSFFDLFTLRYMFSDISNSKEIIFSCKSYPKSIETFEIYKRTNTKKNTFSSGKVLILTGSNNCSNQDISKVYEKIIDIFSSLNFNCFIKDHPRSQARLNFKSNKLRNRYIELDPSVPVEILDDNFDFVIGVTSIGLIYFGERSISVIDAVKCIPSTIRKNSKKHLTLMPGGNHINFVNDLDEIAILIKNRKDISIEEK